MALNKKIVFLGFLLIFLLVYGNIKIQKAEIPERYIYISLNISNYSNAWMQGENIYFISESGSVAKGNTIIKNNENKKVKIELILSGELYSTGILSVSETSFYLNPQENKEVELKLVIPNNFSGESIGKILVRG